MRSTGTRTRTGTVVAAAVLFGAAMAAGPAGATQHPEAERAREALERALVEQRAALARAEMRARHERALGGMERTRQEVRARDALVRAEARRMRERLAADGMRQRAALERMEIEMRALRGFGLVRGGYEPVAAEVPGAWLAQDPADSLYRAAREELNRGRWERAAGLFAEIREKHPESGYVADSYYFQALALQRAGDTRSLRRALELLDVQEERHRGASTVEDARALRVRIEGALARTGDAEAAVRIQERAAAGCEGEEQELRSAALGALLNMDAERALPILREVLRSRDACSAELRKRAVFLISQKMSPETVDILLDLAHRNPDPDPEVREAAVFWLSQVRSEEAVAALESILEGSNDPAVQEKAIFAISQHPSDRAGAVMRSYAERTDAPRELREKAIFWIGQRRGEENKAYLRELFGTLADQELKEKVIFGVAQGATEADRRWLIDLARDVDEPVDLRKNALFWAGQSGGVPAADLQALYRTLPDPEMKEQVIFALSQKRGEEAVTALMEIAEAEEDAKLRQRAVFWLGQTDDPRVPEFLLRIIRGGG